MGNSDGDIPAQRLGRADTHRLKLRHVPFRGVGGPTFQPPVIFAFRGSVDGKLHRQHEARLLEREAVEGAAESGVLRGWQRLDDHDGRIFHRQRFEKEGIFQRGPRFGVFHFHEHDGNRIALGELRRVDQPILIRAVHLQDERTAILDSPETVAEGESQEGDQPGNQTHGVFLHWARAECRGVLSETESSAPAGVCASE